MMMWPPASTGSSCLMPPPKREPIPAAMMSKVVSILFPFYVFPLLLVHKERPLFSAVFAFRKQPPFIMICSHNSWTAVLYQKCVRNSALYLYLSRDHHGLRAVWVPVYHAVRHTQARRRNCRSCPNQHPPLECRPSHQPPGAPLCLPPRHGPRGIHIRASVIYILQNVAVQFNALTDRKSVV